jgi:hypothetical protein
MEPQDTATLVVTEDGALVWLGAGEALLGGGRSPAEAGNWFYRDRRPRPDGGGGDPALPPVRVLA